MRKLSIGLVAAGAVALGGCAYNGLGLGVGYGSPYGAYGSYGPYGQYGGYGGYNPYYDPYFSYGSRYSWGYSPWGYSRYYSPYGAGWYNGFYYPGTGIYVYDRDRRRRELNPQERSFWQEVVRRARLQAGSGATSSAVVQPRSTRLTTVTTAAPTVRSVEREARAQRVLERRAERAERRAERRSSTTTTSNERRRRSRDD